MADQLTGVQKGDGWSREENTRTSRRHLTAGASGVLNEGTVVLALAGHDGVHCRGPSYADRPARLISWFGLDGSSISLTGARRLRLAVDRLVCGSRFREATRDPTGVVPVLTGRGAGFVTSPAPAAHGTAAPPTRAGRPARVPARRAIANAEFGPAVARPNQSLQGTGALARRRRQVKPAVGAPVSELRR